MVQGTRTGHTPQIAFAFISLRSRSSLRSNVEGGKEEVGMTPSAEGVELPIVHARQTDSSLSSDNRREPTTAMPGGKEENGDFKNLFSRGRWPARPRGTSHRRRRRGSRTRRSARPHGGRSPATVRL